MFVFSSEINDDFEAIMNYNLHNIVLYIYIYGEKFKTEGRR